MRTVFDIFMTWPMPAVWLLLPGLLFLRRRIGRVLVLVAGILLLAGSTPLVGQALLRGLEAGAPAFDPALHRSDDFDAIVVPLSGAFVDPAGRWWPLPGSINRTVRGQRLQSETGLPLMVLGGAPYPGQNEAEAVALQRMVALAPETVVESTARDTFETAQAVARALSARSPNRDRPPRVIVVTSASHIARMAASLRRFGVDSAAAPPPRFHDPRLARDLWLDAVPSVRGLGNVRVALREYMGIAWYIVTGRIRLRDL